MQRLGAVFIAVCMVAISTSVGAILYFRFNLTIPEASPIAFGVLLTLLLVHYQISRVRDRLMIDEQMDDLTRLKLGLTKELQDVREMAQLLDQNVSDRVQKEIEPILAELDVIGSLVKQLAESCAELDERVQNGDEQVDAVRAQLTSATESVKELETLLRSTARTSYTEEKVQPQPPVQGTATAPSNPSAFAKPEASAPKEPSTPFQSELDKIPEREPEISEEDDAAVRRALALGQIEMFMQPIVSLPMRKPLFYEALSRLKAEDGSVITPDIFLPVCRKNGFMPMLDRLAINETFKLLRRLADRNRAVECFCNLSLQSLGDSEFFALMRDLFDDNRDLVEHVILEFSQADMRNFGILEDETLQLLRGMGFRFSVDRVTNLAGDFDALARKGVRYAKIAAPVLTHREAGRGLDIHPADFSRVLSRKGMELIVTHVETERTLVSLIDFGVNMAQGDHFAPAKALKGAADEARGASSAQELRPTHRERSEPRPIVGSQQRIRPQDVPAPRVHGLGESGGNPQSRSDEPKASGRMLGDNPKIAQALRSMAAQDGDADATRSHFRNVLAEAAGLIETDGAQRPSPQPSAAPAPTPGSVADRLPATEDFGLRTSTDRGQFLDLSEPVSRPEPRANRSDDAPHGSNPQSFQRLIR